MRLSLLAVGALAGIPPMSWAFRVQLAAANGAEMEGISAEAEKAPFEAIPLLPPSIPSVSFVSLSSTRKLAQEQLLARRLMTQRPSGLAILPTQQMTHRGGTSPKRPVVLQQPRPREFFLYPTPGAARPPVSPELARAMIPAGVRGIGQPGGRGHYALASRGGHLAARAVGGPLSLQPTPGLKYVRAMSECVWPPEEPPEEPLSQEELKAAQEARAEQEAQFKRQIVEVVKSNLEDAEEGTPATEEEEEFPVNTFAMEALTKMTGARVGTKEAVLRNVRDEATNKRLMSKCRVRQIKVLGSGAMAVVIEVELVDEACKKALRMDRLAVKMMYGDPKGKPITEILLRGWRKVTMKRFAAEKHALKLLAAAMEPGQSVQGLLKERHWVVPLYTASANESGQPYIHEGLLFNPHLLLSKTMLADGLRLTHSSRLVPRAQLPVAAREYVCGELIKAVARLHEIGLAHYDIKASNSLLDFDGSVHLGDFGRLALAFPQSPVLYQRQQWMRGKYEAYEQQLLQPLQQHQPQNQVATSGQQMLHAFEGQRLPTATPGTTVKSSVLLLSATTTAAAVVGRRPEKEAPQQHEEQQQQEQLKPHHWPPAARVSDLALLVASYMHELSWTLAQQVMRKEQPSFFASLMRQLWHQPGGCVACLTPALLEWWGDRTDAAQLMSFCDQQQRQTLEEGFAKLKLQGAHTPPAEAAAREVLAGSRAVAALDLGRVSWVIRRRSSRLLSSLDVYFFKSSFEGAALFFDSPRAECRSKCVLLLSATTTAAAVVGRRPEKEAPQHDGYPIIEREREYGVCERQLYMLTTSDARPPSASVLFSLRQ
ncbi:hypothetical protein Emag_001200 [Eimeria magna]